MKLLYLLSTFVIWAFLLTVNAENEGGGYVLGILNFALTFPLGSCVMGAFSFLGQAGVISFNVFNISLVNGIVFFVGYWQWFVLGPWIERSKLGRLLFPNEEQKLGQNKNSDTLNLSKNKTVPNPNQL